MVDAIKALENALGVRFKNRDLLSTALTHRSYLNEHRTHHLPHNERLEFLGDAVLELVITEHLYATYPNPEGELTSWRSAVVRGEMLAKIAGPLGVGEALFMSRGEEKSGGRSRQALLANAFEALLGALYLDQGYDAAKELIHRHVVVLLPKIIASKQDRDPKSGLQEEAQDKFGVTPRYEILTSSGPDHAKEFTVGVFIRDHQVGQGSGASKQQAEQAAAAAALAAKLESP